MTDQIRIFLLFLSSFSVTFALLPGLMRVASQIGLIDHPGNRKIHKYPKPPVGGIGILLGVFMSCILFIPLSNFRGLYFGLILLALTGFFDDYLELSYRWKFLAQALASLSMIYLSNTFLHSFGDLLALGPINFHRASVFITIFSAIGIINAINMIDGLDGLAGGISLVSFFSFTVLALLSNQIQLAMLIIAFMGGIIAFLSFNWHPSKLFMGDAGSMTIGFVMTFMSIYLTQDNKTTIPPVAPLLILTIPISDTLTVMSKRFVKGQHPFRPDNNHLHHILLRFKFSKRATASIIISLSAFFSAIAIAGTVFRWPEYYMFASFSIFFAVYFISSFHIKKLFVLLEKVRTKQKSKLLKASK